MEKQYATQLMSKAVKAFKEGDPDFQSIMDDASVRLTDEQWKELELLLIEASKKPALPETPKQEQDRLESQVARLRAELAEAEKQLNAFYARKHVKARKG